MKTQAVKSRQTYGAKQSRRLMSGVSALTHVVSMGMGAAQAQTAPAAPQAATPEKEVVVTGIRAAIQKSIAIKRKSESVVEAVTAEDIGKLPDISIAESLARLPGLAAQRVDGRSQDLSIRGMPGSFAVTLLNGMEMVSTGDNRSFEYDQFPSELVSTAQVYKTPDAALGTMGLSGTVNITTAQPLDYHKRKFNISARADSNSFKSLIPGTKSNGSRLSASYIDQFDDGKVGIALGYAHLDSPNRKKYFNPFDYGTGGDLGVDNVTSQYTYDGFEMGVASTKTVRDGYLGVVEFKPNADVHSKVDLFYSKFDQHMRGNEIAGATANWSGGSTPTSSVINGNGLNLHTTNFTPIITMRGDNRQDKISAIDWNTDIKMGDWTSRVDLNYSKADRDETVAEGYVSPTNPITLDILFPSNFRDFGQLKSAFNFADSSPTNLALASSWGGNIGGVVDVFKVKDENKAVRLSAKRDVNWGPVSSFEGGITYNNRTKSLAQTRTLYDLTSGVVCSPNGDINCEPIPASLVQSPADLSFAGVGGLINIDIYKALSTSSAYTPEAGRSQNPGFNWDVEEKITNAFAKFGLKFDAVIPFRGNFGIQVLRTEQTAHGIAIDGNGDPYKATGGKSYTDVLPSLNLVGDIAPSTLLRIGIGKTLARPSLTFMRAGISADVDNGSAPEDAGKPTWHGSGGNPTIQPWRAVDFDVTLEHYFGKSSYISLALFDKQILKAIYVDTVKYNFKGYTNTSAFTPASDIGFLSGPANTDKGYVRGLELSGTLDGALISPSLDGFGLLASYAYTESNLKASDAFGNKTNWPLEGLSKNVWGLTAYYEKHGFQARISKRYRSEFTALRRNAFSRVTELAQPEGIVDGQIGYTFEEGPMKGLGILLQANNLTNQPYSVRQVSGTVSGVQQHHEFGTEYLLGVSYKF